MIPMRSGSKLYFARIRSQPADGRLDVVQLTWKLHLRARANRDAGDRVAGRQQLRSDARRRSLARVRHPRRAARPDHDGQAPARGRTERADRACGRCSSQGRRSVVDVGVRRRRPGKDRRAARGRCSPSLDPLALGPRPRQEPNWQGPQQPRCDESSSARRVGGKRVTWPPQDRSRWPPCCGRNAPVRRIHTPPQARESNGTPARPPRECTGPTAPGIGACYLKGRAARSQGRTWR